MIPRAIRNRYSSKLKEWIGLSFHIAVLEGEVTANAPSPLLSSPPSRNALDSACNHHLLVHFMTHT